MGPLDLPLLPAEPSADERVILIAHSAGGWMSRIYLSEAKCVCSRSRRAGGQQCCRCCPFYAAPIALAVG